MTDQHGENPIEPTDPGSGQPDGAATPPPADAPAPPAPAAPAAPAAPRASSRPQYAFSDAQASLESANKLDLGIVAAGVVALIGSWLPFYTISVKAAGLGVSASDSVSAWHGFFGWFAVLVALATSVAIALVVFNVVKLPMPAHQIAVGGFGLALLLMILTLFVDPAGCGGAGAFGVSCNIGRGFGYWLALLAVLAGGALSFMRMRESTAGSATA
jgi:hypothetical protein